MTFIDHYPGFQGHNIFWSQISEGQLQYTNRKPYLTQNGTMFGDLDWPLNATRGLSAIAEFLVGAKDDAGASEMEL